MNPIPWTTKQERIVIELANLGAEAIAQEIKSATGVARTPKAVRRKAERLGVSLAMYQVCPRCGAKVRKLNRMSGLCKTCNAKKLRDDALVDRATILREIEANERSNKEFERVNHEYLAVSRTNQRLAKEHGIPPKRSRGTHFEREV